MITARGRDLDDVSELVFGARVGGVHLVRLALGVVGQDHVDLARHEIDVHVLRPVHLGRADEIGGEARLDHDVALVLEAEVLVEPRAFPVQRDPRPVPSASNFATDSVP